MPIQTGTNLGAYEVQEMLGQGAMGTVYRAYHSGLARTAAVKVLQALSPDPDANARFQREAQAIAQLRHPNILNVYDFGEFDGTPYMIVEYMAGGSLSDRMKQGVRFDQATSLQLLQGVAAGLDHAHNAGIVHRDVKPANVLVEGESNAVLADFGLAKLLQQTSVKTMSGVTTGTPAYMAPEQVMGLAVGPAADTYALATMAYEFLTGGVPFEGEGMGMMELLFAHVNRVPPLASTRNPALSPAVDAVLARGLAKEPEARWESCSAMIAALRSAVLQEAVVDTARVPVIAGAAGAQAVDPTMVMTGPPPASPVPTRRRRWPLVLAGIAILALVAALVLVAVLSRPRPAITLSSGRVAVGQPLTVNLKGFKAGEQVDLFIGGATPTRVRAVRADTNGAASTIIDIPRTFPTGQEQVKACGASQNCVTTPLTIVR